MVRPPIEPRFKLTNENRVLEIPRVKWPVIQFLI